MNNKKLLKKKQEENGRSTTRVLKLCAQFSDFIMRKYLLSLTAHYTVHPLPISHHISAQLCSSMQWIVAHVLHSICHNLQDIHLPRGRCHAHHSPRGRGDQREGPGAGRRGIRQQSVGSGGHSSLAATLYPSYINTSCSSSVITTHVPSMMYY